MATSFPYLKVSRDTGVSYGRVLQFVEWLDSLSGDIGVKMRPEEWSARYRRLALKAWKAERARRVDAAPAST